MKGRRPGEALNRSGGGMNHAPVAQMVSAATHRSGGQEGLQLVLLGGFQLLRDQEEVSLPLGAKRVLAFMALHAQPLQRSYVAGCLWPDATEARSSASLRSTLWRIRRSTVPVVCAYVSHLWLTDGLAVDVREVVGRVRRLMDRSKPSRPEDLDPTPLTGELLPDWSLDDWILVERERLRQLCLHGLEALCLRLMAIGHYGLAVEAGLSAVRGEPLRESAHRALISVHLAEGNPSEALRQYRWYERILREELDIGPSPRITRLVAGIHQAV